MLLRNLQGGHFYWDTVYTEYNSERILKNRLCQVMNEYQVMFLTHGVQ